MKLSEAIRIGSAIRPPSHQERFCHVEGRGLCSDVWGAACEAIDPHVANLNWNPNNKTAFDAAMAYLNDLQHRHFGQYFKMPARCPLARRSMFRGAGRIINRKGEYKIDDGGKVLQLAGVTSECEKVGTIAGYTDHAYYKHGNSREEVAEIIAEYEEARDKRVLLAIEHYQNDRIRRHIAQRSMMASLETARQREQQRKNNRRIFAVN